MVGHKRKAFGFTFSSSVTGYVTLEKSLYFFGLTFQFEKWAVDVIPFQVLLLEYIKNILLEKRKNRVYGYSPNYKGNERCLRPPYKVLIKWLSRC